MDNNTIFSKTAKGLREATGATSELARSLRAVLKEVDGKKPLYELRQKFGKYSDADFQQAMRTLELEEYVRDTLALTQTVVPLNANQTARKAAQEGRKAPEPGNLDDLDFTTIMTPLDENVLRQEDEAKAKREAAQNAELLALAKAKRDAEEKTRRESAERAKREAEAKAKQAMLAKAKQEADEKARIAALEQARRDAEEQARIAAEALARREAEETARNEAEARARREAEERARRAAAEKSKREAEERARKFAEERARQNAEARTRQEAEDKLKREEEERARQEAIARARKEAEEKAREEAEQKARLDVEAAARKAAEELAQREAEEQARQQEELAAQKVAEEKARLDAEEKARKAAEETARIEAEAAAKQAAEEQARRTAEEKARQEAELATKKAEEEKARLEAEAAELTRKRKEAEEKALRDAEERAQREAEERIRKEEEAAAQKAAEEARERRIAEEKAQREAELAAQKAAHEAARQKEDEELRAQKEAELRAQQEAEARVRREAEEEKARLVVEARLKQEAEENARREAEELARREAEERARQEAEAEAQKAAEAAARAAAEEKARIETEARKIREAEKLAAWERTKQKAEAKLRQEAEEKRLQEAHEKELAEREAAEQVAEEAAARTVAKAAAASDREEIADQSADLNHATGRSELALDEPADPVALREVVDKLRQPVALPFGSGKGNDDDLELRPLADEVDKRKERLESERKAEELVAKMKARTSIFAHLRWGKLTVMVLIFAGILAVARMHYESFDSRIPELKQMASEQFQQPVEIGALYFSLFPRPQWQLEDVTIGDKSKVTIPRINATIDLGKILSERWAFDAIVLASPMLNEEALGTTLFSKSAKQVIKTKTISASSVYIKSAAINMPRFDVKAQIGEDGNWKAMTLDIANREVFVDLFPESDRVRFEASAITFLPPFGGKFEFNDFRAKGSFGRNELIVSEFEGRNFGGAFAGNAVMSWSSGWRMDGVVNAKQPNAKNLAPALIGSGHVDGKARYLMQAADAKTLFAAPRLEGEFAVGEGTLLGVDLMHRIQNGTNTGKTPFRQLRGTFVREGDATVFRQIRLDAGMLSASGSAVLDANSALRGRFAASLAFDNQQRGAAVSLAGTLDKPKFDR